MTRHFLSTFVSSYLEYRQNDNENPNTTKSKMKKSSYYEILVV